MKTAAINAPLIVRYKEEYIHHTEECHGIKDLGGWIKELESVKVFIGEKAIDLTKFLTADMENFICNQLNEMEDEI